MNSIILIDDRQDFIRDFTNAAYAKGIGVAPKNSLDGLKELLPAYAHKYAAVVLDIKCLLKDDQAKEDDGFIGDALNYLNLHVPRFPRFILTGDESAFDGLKRFHKNEKIFIKQPDDQEKLLDELLYCVQHAEPLRIRRENYKVFEAFDLRLLPASKEAMAINIFKHYHETNPANFKGIIGDIRELHEEIYKALNARNQAVVPNRFINNYGSPVFGDPFHNHLMGRSNITPGSQPYQDTTINSLTKFIHGACSEYLHNTSQIQYQISPYTLKSLINGLMEVIIWSKQYR